MKGKLKKLKEQWWVIRVEEGDWETYYPLHPDDVEQIRQDSQIFDNIEARILAWPNVEFAFAEVDKNAGHSGKSTRYAKLIPKIDENNYPLVEGTLNLCQEIIKNRAE